MKISDKTSSETHIKYSVSGNGSELSVFKTEALNELKRGVKVPGFRPNKAPLELIEKHIELDKLQNEFLNRAINQLYLNSVDEQKLRVVSEPTINVLKFVPYDLVEFSVDVDIISSIKLPDYTKFTLKPKSTKVTKEQLDGTLAELQKRVATYKVVDRPSKLGDQVTIDFRGFEEKTGDKLERASGLDYKIILGSKTFIPGFEEKLVGFKPEVSTEFTITFPKEYHDQSFINKKVKFEVEIKQIEEVEQPKLNDEFAAKIGPFKTYKELETELKKQLESENKVQAQRDFQDQLLNQLADKIKVEVPTSLVETETSRLEAEAKQNALYRGQTWQEYLVSIGETEASYKEKIDPLAISRIKGGLAIGEISNLENIQVSNNEVQEKINELKKQYSDEQMRAELDKPENQREIAMRLLTEKVLSFIKAKLPKS